MASNHQHSHWELPVPSGAGQPTVFPGGEEAWLSLRRGHEHCVMIRWFHLIHATSHSPFCRLKLLIPYRPPFRASKSIFCEAFVLVRKSVTVTCLCFSSVFQSISIIYCFDEHPFWPTRCQSHFFTIRSMVIDGLTINWTHGHFLHEALVFGHAVRWHSEPCQAGPYALTQCALGMPFLFATSPSQNGELGSLSFVDFLVHYGNDVSCLTSKVITGCPGCTTWDHLHHSVKGNTANRDLQLSMIFNLFNKPICFNQIPNHSFGQQCPAWCWTSASCPNHSRQLGSLSLSLSLVDGFALVFPTFFVAFNWFWPPSMETFFQLPDISS